MKKHYNRLLAIILCVCMIIGLSPAMMSLPAAAASGDSPPDHLIINQVYGGGSADGAVSNSFIELYNPTDNGIDVSSWSIQCIGEDPAKTATGSDWKKLDLSGSIPSHTSYLIRGNGNSNGGPLTGARYTIVTYDQDWNIYISNRAYKIALVKNNNTLAVTNPTATDGVVDLVGATNDSSVKGGDSVDAYENTPFNGMSKQKSIRRVNFVDTDNNASDFTALDYRSTGITDDQLAMLKPRSLADGVWGAVAPPVTDLPNHVIINQAYGAGTSNDGSVSHSFVELYNPTNTAVSLDGWSVKYTGPVVAGADSETSTFALTGSIPAKTSYLIRGNGAYNYERPYNGTAARYEVNVYDAVWDCSINNRAFSLLLIDDTGKTVDLVGAINTVGTDSIAAYETNPVTGMSKQKTIRRINNFQDTDANAADFEVLDYRTSGINDVKLGTVQPRSLNDGAWNTGDTKTVTPPSSLPVAPVTANITFSQPAGLYPAPFNLTLSTTTSGAVIRYTLNGDDPSFDSSSTSVTYTAPLYMMAHKNNANSLSQIGAGPGSGAGGGPLSITGPRSFTGNYYNPPATGSNFEGTVVKAQLFTADGKPLSDVYINSYFVDPNIYTKYGNLPVISVSTPSKYLFDPETGIYVAGNNAPASFNWGNNFSVEGTTAFERPTYVEMFDPTSGLTNWATNEVISQGMGVRPQGGAIRQLPQKSWRFYSRTGTVGDNYPILKGKSVIDYDLFNGSVKDNAGNTITQYKRFILRDGGNDINIAFMRDSLASVIAKESNLNCEVVGYRPVVMFLNGEFWGIYHMLERDDDQYLASHFGGNNNDYDILENPSNAGITLSQGTEASINYYNNTVADIEAVRAANGNTANNDIVYNEIKKYVDEDNLIDYTIMEIFSGNNDWVNLSDPNKVAQGIVFDFNTKTSVVKDIGISGNNQEIWRYTGTPTGQPGQDGRYRWILSDMDYAFGIYGQSANSGEMMNIALNNKNNFYFFHRLWENDNFKKKFLKRFMDLLSTSLSYSSTSAVLNTVKADMEPAIAEHGIRWTYFPAQTQWASNVSGIDTWLRDRANPNSGITANGLNQYLSLLDGVSDTASVVQKEYAVYTDDLTLPSIVDVTDLDGNPGTAAVTWADDTSGLLASAKAYDMVPVTGTVDGYGTITVNVEVIPHNLIYFIDSGTIGDRDTTYVTPNADASNVSYQGGQGLKGSAAYDAIAARIAEDSNKTTSLMNIVSDQLYDENWGVRPGGIQFPVDLVGFSDQKLANGYVGYDQNGSYIEYILNLPAGNYNITTGHMDWWGKFGGNPRAIQITFNDKLVYTKKFGTFGDSVVETSAYTQLEDGQLSIKVYSYAYDDTTKDGAVLSFIGVQAVGNDTAECTVTFNANNGDTNAVTTMTVFGGGYVTPPAVTKAGYNLDGWFAPDATIPFSFSDPIISDIILTAQWTLDTSFTVDKTQYNEIVYSDDRHALPDTVDIKYADGTTQGTAAVTWDYTDVDKAQDYSVVQETGTVAGWDGTITATVEILPRHTIYYIDAAAGTPGGTSEYDAVRAKLSDDGVTLLNNSAEQEYDGSWGIGYHWFDYHWDNTGLDPKQANGYVGYDVGVDGYNPDLLYSSRYVEYKLCLPAGTYNITTGHSSNTGWNNPRTMHVAFNGDPVGNDITFTGPAQYAYQKNTYIQANDGELSIIVYNISDDGPTLSFIGVEALGDVTTHTVTFDSNGGTITSGKATVKVADGYTVSAPTVNRDSYTFDGWYNGDTKFDFNTPITTDITLTAKWEDEAVGIVGGPAIYAAAYYQDTSSLPSTAEVEYASGKTESADIIWDDITPFTSAEKYATIYLTGKAGGLDITAKIEVVPNNLTYFIDSGTAADLTPTYFPSYLSPEYPNIFGSPYDAVNNLTRNSLLNKASDQTFDGNWGVIRDSVQFPVSATGYYDQKLADGYVGYDDYYANPNDLRYNPDKKLYIEYDLYLPAGTYEITTGHFCWWSQQLDGDGNPIGGFPRTMHVLFNDEVAANPPAGEFQFTTLGDHAVYTNTYTQTENSILTIKVANVRGDGPVLSFIGVAKVGEIIPPTTYTVTFADWDGTELKTQSVEYGSAATEPTNPTRSGYTFAGWDKDFSNVTADMTVTAEYTVNTYTVTFADWDGTELKTQSVEYGSAATAPTNLTRSGYTFAGWDKTYDNVTENLTVTALWEEATTEPTTEATTEPTTEATTESTTEATTESTTEATTESTTEAIYYFPQIISKPDNTAPTTSQPTTEPVQMPPVAYDNPSAQVDITNPDTPLADVYINPYNDVSDDDWFAEAVKNMTQLGLMTGISDDEFGPALAVNRFMLVTVLYRAQGEPLLDSNSDAPFTDTYTGQWYSDALAWAYANGLIKGFEDGTFRGDDTLTVEQIIVVLYRYAEFLGYDVSARADLTAFADAADVSDWAAEAMSWAVAVGLIKGNADALLLPSADVSRAEFADIMTRFMFGIFNIPQDK